MLPVVTLALVASLILLMMSLHEASKTNELKNEAVLLGYADYNRTNGAWQWTTNSRRSSEAADTRQKGRIMAINGEGKPTEHDPAQRHLQELKTAEVLTTNPAAPLAVTKREPLDQKAEATRQTVIQANSEEELAQYRQRLSSEVALAGGLQKFAEGAPKPVAEEVPKATYGQEKAIKPETDMQAIEKN